MADYPVLKAGATLADVQAYIGACVAYRGYKDTIQSTFIMLAEEVGELAKSLRQLQGGSVATDSAKVEAESEVADVMWMLACVCNEAGIDLEQAFRAKAEKNKSRTWQ